MSFPIKAVRLHKDWKCFNVDDADVYENDRTLGRSNSWNAEIQSKKTNRQQHGTSVYDCKEI